MPLDLASRYSDLQAFEIRHATRGLTRSLPLRRPRLSGDGAIAARHNEAAEPLDGVAMRQLGREDRFWMILDLRPELPPPSRLPEEVQPGEVVSLPSRVHMGRVRRPGP